MGNTLSNQSTQAINVENFIKDFKEFQFIEKIKINRFLKTFLVKYSKNYTGTPQKVLIKLYGRSIDDTKKINRSVHDIRKLKKLFSEIPSIVTYDDIIVSEKSCMAYRPWIHYNLYDRLSTRPFLTEIEKIWIVYQILRALNHIHGYLAHGDLKLENILITSWGFVIVSDLSFQIKPTYLCTETVTNEFNYFFDTSGRQSCYIAPERLKRVTSSSIFYADHHEDELGPFVLAETEYSFLSNIDLVPPMDIFSLGCMIFQIFTDGKILFKLSDLLSYWKGELTSMALEKIIRQNVQNNFIGDMIISMTSLSPISRMSAHEYLQNNNLFPEYFVFLYEFALKTSKFKHSPEFLIVVIKKEWETVLKIIEEDTTSYNGNNLCVLLIINVSTTCASKLTSTKSKVEFLEMMCEFSSYCDSEIILNRIIPYVIHFVKDISDEVRELVPFCVVNIIKNVHKLYNLEELNLFTDYIFPKLRLLELDSSLKIRIQFARALPDLCVEAFRLYFMIKECVNTKSIDKCDIYINGMDSELDSVYETIKKINKSFLTDPYPFVRKFYIKNSLVKVNTILNDILPFNRETRDDLLSHTIDVLNNKHDWSMRVSFYEVLPQLIFILGVSAITHLMPLLCQGLLDSCEWVVCSALHCLKHILNSEHVLNDYKISLIKSTVIFLIHPNPSIRHESFSLLESCFSSFTFIEYQATVADILKPYLYTHSRHFLYYLPTSNFLSSMILKPIPYIVFDIFLNRLSSIRFLNFIEKNSEAIRDERLPNDILCEDFLEIHDDSILNLLKKYRFDTRLGLYKILLTSDYIKRCIKEHPANASVEENKENLESLVLKKFDFQRVDLGDILEFNDSYFHDECATIPNLASVSPGVYKENNESDTIELEYHEFSNLIKCSLDTFEANLINICKKRHIHYKTYMYAKNYVNNYKYTLLDEFKGKNVKNTLTLVSCFKPHIDSVTRLGPIESSSHFTTASDDCTVKLWDSNQMDASKFNLKYEPIYVYSQMSGRISSVRNLKISHGSEIFYRIACSSSEDSDIQIFDVISGDREKTQRHPFHRCLVDWTRDGGVVELTSNNIHSNPLLIAATLYSSVLGYDIREKACQPSLRLVAPKEGYLTSLECDPFGCWIASGTSTGVVHLWDIRFIPNPVRSIQTYSKTAISRLQVNSMDFKQIFCGFDNSLRPISMYNLETGLCMASFSTYSGKATSCTGIFNASILGSTHVFFSCTDGIIRDWNVFLPHKSSILVPSSEIAKTFDKISCTTRVSPSNTPLETKESFYPDSVLIQEKILHYKGSIKTFCTDLCFLPINNILVGGMVDGSIYLYK